MRAAWHTFWTDPPVRRWLAALVLAMALASPFACAAATGGVGLVGVRLGGDAAGTRVVLDLDASVTGRSLSGESAPGRLVFAFPALLSTDPLRGTGRGLVTAWNIVDDPSGARLVLEVKPGVVATRRFLIPPIIEGGHWRYVIDIAPQTVAAGAVASASDTPRPLAVRPPVAVASAATDATRLTSLPLGPSNPAPRVAVSFHAPTVPALTTDAAWEADPGPLREAYGPPVAGGPTGGLVAMSSPSAREGQVSMRPPPAARPASQRPPIGRGVKVIVVDAGHGGHDPGARSLVRNEKDITLAAALDLKARLERMGRYKVVLTRDSDVFIPLETRVRIARQAGADLFISLHADSAGSDPTPHGASIYTLSDSGQQRVNYVLGPHEWFGRAGDHHTDPGVRQILLDLTQRSTRNRSSEFAGVLLQHISDSVDLLPRTHRDAGYFVLLAPDVPAVLLEMGFITNPADEMRLTDPAQRGRLMDGVAGAIDAYFSGGTRLAAG